MFPGMYSTAVQMEINAQDPVCDNLEAYAHRYGTVVTLPTLRDRLTLRVGHLLIKIGQKLTDSSLKNMHLSKDLA